MQTAMKAKLRPSQGVNFAVVSNPGTLFEKIEDYAQNMAQALEAKDCHDEPTYIMRILADGQLTTEF